MLDNKQLDEIKEHLDKAQNPIFFFDNDADGLCSFLLLARAYGKGKGVAIKSFPSLDKSYARKLYELKPDYVFILDKPVVARDFFEEAINLNLPVVWIDHHEVDNNNIEGIYCYNSMKGEKKSSEPVTYWCYQVAGKKEDLWLALIGCIGDNFLPEFVNEFKKEYPELLGSEIKTAFQALYKTEIGKITRILNFGLKDRTSNVIKMIKFLLKVSSPKEILDEDTKIFSRFKQVDKKYQKLLEKVFLSQKETKDSKLKEKLIYFQYGGSLSLSGDIANELNYRFPDKIIVVAYISGDKANISLRGKNVKEITLKAISGLQNATGGGHKDATGAKVSLEDLAEFKEKIESLVFK